jgi:hypothetical protein
MVSRCSSPLAEEVVAPVVQARVELEVMEPMPRLEAAWPVVVSAHVRAE